MRKLDNNQKIAIITTLTLLAIVLGFFIYQQKVPNLAQTKKSDSTQTVSSAADDEKKLFAVPGPNASQDEIRQHSELAARLAVLGNQVDLNSCKAQPEVLQIQQAAALTVKNNDTLQLAMTVDSDHIYYIDAGKSLTIKADFAHGPGLYGYRCKNNLFEGLAGFINVTP